jgi:serine/threonine protein kinase
MAESAAAAAAAGRKTRVGPYDLGKTIGEGSFAKVKLARDARTGAVCAIKVLDRNHVLRHKMVEQVRRAAARPPHPFPCCCSFLPPFRSPAIRWNRT